MTKKKILYVEQNTDRTIGGSYFSLLFLVEGLNKKKYSPLAVFYQKNQLIPRFEQAGCKILLLRKTKSVNFPESLPWLINLSHYLVLRLLITGPLIMLQKITNYFITFIFPSFSCWNILRKERIDLIHLNNTLLRPQQWILASLFTNAKIIAHERGINNLFPFQSRFWARNLKAIICISDAVKNNLLKYEFPPAKLYRIYNGLDPDKFTNKKNKEESLKEFGIKPACPVVGIVGNIKVWKGQETVIRSMKSVRKAFPDIKCLLIGGVSPFDRDYLTYLEGIVENEKLEDCIIFTGQRNDVPSLINSLNVLVHASVLSEPFGRVLLEGMALKKPVITTNIGAGPEIVEAGKTGLLVNPGDEAGLADAIISLLRDSDKAVEMGKAGRIRLEKYFNISENVEKTEKLYYRILS